MNNGIFKTEIVPDYIYDKTAQRESFYINNSSLFSRVTTKEEKLKELESLTRVYNSLKREDENSLTHHEALDKMFNDIMKLWNKVVG